MSFVPLSPFFFFLELDDVIEDVSIDEEPFLGQFEKHLGPVFDLQVHRGLLYTCSWDNTARAYSLTVRQATFLLLSCVFLSNHHVSFNMIFESISSYIVFLCVQSRECQAVFRGHTDKVNCLVVSPPLNRPACLFTGSNDQSIRCYRLKVENIWPSHAKRNKPSNMFHL